MAHAGHAGEHVLLAQDVLELRHVRTHGLQALELFHQVLEVRGSDDLHDRCHGTAQLLDDVLVLRRAASVVEHAVFDAKLHHAPVVAFLEQDVPSRAHAREAVDISCGSRIEPHAGGQVHFPSSGNLRHGKVLERAQVADTVDDRFRKAGHGQTGYGARNAAQGTKGQR